MCLFLQLVILLNGYKELIHQWAFNVHGWKRFATPPPAWVTEATLGKAVVPSGWD